MNYVVIARHIGTAIRAMGPGLGSLLEAALLLTGAAAIAYGAWQAYPPAGPIVGGVLLIAGVILRARGNG
jgi:hypothetical protein